MLGRVDGDACPGRLLLRGRSEIPGVAMLLLDTAGMSPDQRVGAVRAALGQATVPCRIDQLEPPEAVRSRMHLWTFGQTSLFTNDASGYRLTRTARHLRMEAPPVVAIAIQSRGRGRFAQLGHEQVVGPGDLMLNDLTAPYTFSWSGPGGSRAVQISYEHLGLPVDVVRRAAGRLPASPLHGLVHAHLHQLVDRADDLAADASAAAVGSATIELVRALVASAADDEGLARPVLAETLMSRVTTFVGLHAREPDLTPERIALAHSVSVRQLYKACAEAGVSLEQSIIDQRLEAARTELAMPSGRRRSVAAIARACGFRDPSHFARRFRAAYGLTPRDWQNLSR